MVKRRLINPAKCDLGVVSQHILKRIIKTVQGATGFNLWESTWQTLCWFKNLPESRPRRARKMRFLSYDIEGFYPAITEETLKKAISFAEQHCEISDQEKEIIMQSRRSFLICDGEPWTKKDSNGNFDITQGSFDSCQCCELVGLYMLSEVSKIVPPEFHGIYRDDGLICIEGNKSEFDDIRKALVKVFKENGFKLECKVYVSQVAFLDVKLDISTKLFRPFRKENDTPCYVHKESNHPPVVKKKLPDMINKRINDLSSNEEIFNEEKGLYQGALKRSGHKDYKMHYIPKTEQPKKKRIRSRKVIYFNPPWADNVAAPVGKFFLSAIDTHFPKNHPLHRYYNRNTLKLSYCTTKNLSAHIAAHNRKILYPTEKEVPECNCKKKFKPECPLPGKCTISQVVYQADVITGNNNVKTYFGMTKRQFKLRYREHKQAFKNRNSQHATALSNFIWKCKDAGIDYTIKWSIVCQAPVYKSGSRKCLLCLKEKVAIALCHPARLLNCKSELQKKCVHHIDVELRRHHHK